jgi:hypothetical protein
MMPSLPYADRLTAGALMRINMWIVLAVLLALFAITRYVVHGEHMGDMCAHNPTAAGCEPR